MADRGFTKRYWYLVEHSTLNAFNFQAVNSLLACLVSLFRVVCVCAFLINFMPALVPPSENVQDGEVEDYFTTFLVNLTMVKNL